MKMLEFEAKVKRWGNSLAVVLPGDEAKSNRLKANQVLHVIALPKSDAAKRSFGMLPRLRSGQDVKDELRKELYD